MQTRARPQIQKLLEHLPIAHERERHTAGRRGHAVEHPAANLQQRRFRPGRIPIYDIPDG